MPSPVSVQYERAINLKKTTGKEKYDVSGMVMISDTHLIVADHENENIILLHVENEVIVSDITLSSAPCDIVKLPDNKIAVTLWDEKCVQFISYNNTRLAADPHIDVGEECYCIAYCKGKLVVGCNPGKLVVLDLDGAITQELGSPDMFAGPEKIVVSSDENYLYVSDDSYNLFNTDISRCIKMSMEGNAVHSYEKRGCIRPAGIQELEDGTLLVCYRHKIVRISSNFERCGIKGLREIQENVLYYPWSVAYNKNDHKLYISCSSKQGRSANDTIMLFNVKWE